MDSCRFSDDIFILLVSKLITAEFQTSLRSFGLVRVHACDVQYKLD